MCSGRSQNLISCKTKDFYLEFINLILEPATSLKKWREDEGFDESMLYKSLPLVKKATKEPKLLALQFKIIHHITTCSENLYKWKITQSDKCDYCNNGEKDSMIHALTQCEFTLNGFKRRF